MSPTVQGEYKAPKKYDPMKKIFGDNENSPDDVTIPLNRYLPLSREDFAFNALIDAGEEGLFVNALLRGWNKFRAARNYPASNYSSFRKMIWNMKKKGIIESVPENEIPDKDLKGKAPWKRSFYRLTAKYLPDSLN